MPITRRTMLGLLSGSTFYLSANATAFAAERPVDIGTAEFPHGVASGDPQPNGIMLWTRAVPQPGGAAKVPLLLQLSKREDFASVVLQQAVHTSAASDFTLRAFVDGLEPDTRYYYRFLAGETSVSRTGRTRTAPSPKQARRINLAFASCQSYEQAHYGSWARMVADDREASAEDQIDFVLHLGDFIYERSWNSRRDGSPQSRAVPPFPDGVETEKNRYAVSLADYRHLYKTYLSDPHLQEARARWPFVCTWDDHEFANNNFQGYSTYAGVAKAEAQRKQWSNQAWFEFIPAVLDELEEQPAHNFRANVIAADQEAANQAAIESLRIYRSMRWGKYVDVVLTDCRSYRSAPCLPPGFAATLGMPMNSVELVAIADGGHEYNGGQPPTKLPYGDGKVTNFARKRPAGTILGQEQRDWFLTSLKDSTATWKLWGNALPIMPMRLDMSALPFTDFEDGIFNIDSWAGFPHEVDLLMGALETEKITGVVSLSGDHHMHGAGTLRRSSTGELAAPVAVDFTVAGISSTPLFEEVLWVARGDSPDFAPLVFRETEEKIEPVWNMSLVQGVLAAYTYSQTGIAALADWLGPNTANPGVSYADTTVNGYGLASFDADAVTIRMITMEDCRPAFEQPPAIRYVSHFTVPRWAAGEGPKVQGPQFEGGAPFPFDATWV